MNREIQKVNSGRSETGYYFRMANVFRISKYLCVLLFALFMIMMLFVYGDKITYNNFRYMLKDIDAAVLLRTDESFATVHYRADDPEAITLNGNLVLADQGTVSLYNPAGIRVYSVPVKGQNLRLTADGKYLLIHDSGGHAFTLCNSITRLTGGTAEGVICAADVSPSGAFAIAATSDRTRYAVDVFSDTFAHAATYGVNEPIVDVAVSDSGKALAILSFVSSSDTSDTLIRFAALGDGEYSHTYTLEGEFPILADYSSTSVIVQTDRSTVFYTKDGELIKKASLNGATAVSTAVSSDAYALATQKDGVLYLTLFDRSGNVLYQEEISYPIHDMAFCEDGLLMLSTGIAFHLSMVDGTLTECRIDDAFCILGVGRYGLVCGKKQATAIFTEK